MIQTTKRNMKVLKGDFVPFQDLVSTSGNTFLQTQECGKHPVLDLGCLKLSEKL